MKNGIFLDIGKNGVFSNLAMRVKSCCLCIRFPFLKFNMKANKISEKKSYLWGKWRTFAGNHQQEYFDKFGKDAIDMKGEPIQVYTKEVLKRSHIYDEYVMKIAPFKDRFLFWLYGVEMEICLLLPEFGKYTKLDLIPYGWRKRFGIDFCRELKRALVHTGGKKCVRHFSILDIKEKYGTLDVDCYPVNDEIIRVINKYEYISQYVCISCGEDAVKQTTGWIENYCEECCPDSHWIWIDPIYGWSNHEKAEYNKRIEEELP